MNLRAVCVAAMVAGSVTIGYAQRTFTDVDGRTVLADVKSVSESEVVLVVGKARYTVPLERLVEQDREYLKTWKPAASTGDPRLDVNYSDSVDRSNRNAERNVFQLKVDVRNAGNREAFSGGTLELLVVMRHLRERNVYGVAVRSEHEVGEVAELRSVEVATPEYGYEQKPHEHGGKGWKFFGYVAVLKDRGGEEVVRTASSALDQELVERLLAAQQGDLLGRNYRPLDQGLRGQYDPHLLPKPVTGKKEEKEQPKPKDEPLVE